MFADLSIACILEQTVSCLTMSHPHISWCHYIMVISIERINKNSNKNFEMIWYFTQNMYKMIHTKELFFGRFLFNYFNSKFNDAQFIFIWYLYCSFLYCHVFSSTFLRLSNIMFMSMKKDHMATWICKSITPVTFNVAMVIRHSHVVLLWWIITSCSESKEIKRMLHGCTQY